MDARHPETANVGDAPRTPPAMDMMIESDAFGPHSTADTLSAWRVPTQAQRIRHCTHQRTFMCNPSPTSTATWDPYVVTLAFVPLLSTDFFLGTDTKPRWDGLDWVVYEPNIVRWRLDLNDTETLAWKTRFGSDDLQGARKRSDGSYAPLGMGVVLSPVTEQWLGGKASRVLA